MQYPDADKIAAIVADATRIVIVQADNPDADSLGSALALEDILGTLGKEPILYCGVDIPGYLRYMSGWDRIQKELPKDFDASFIVDASTMTLLEQLKGIGGDKTLAHKPCVVLDHHGTVESMVPFAEVTINDSGRASAGELIYLIAQQLKWPLSLQAQEFIASSILGDTQGLSNQLATPETYRVMAAMIEQGVDRPALEDIRREFSKMPQVILRYKAQLIVHTKFTENGAIASVVIPQVEINQYSPLYNPGPLIQGDLLQTSGVKVAIVFKEYDSGIVTAAIRCNPSAPIAALLASHFGGGGHTYASGFKMKISKPLNEVKLECLQYAQNLLTKLEQDNTEDETIQYAYSTN